MAVSWQLFRGRSATWSSLAALSLLLIEGASAVELQFAGRSWTVKQANNPVGPGPNRFSSSPADVWSDEQGLHLTIHKVGPFWYSTEVILNESHGYGTYAFQTTSRQDLLDANAVFGAFTWDSAGGDTIPNNHNREIDFEDSRWGNPADSRNSQVVVQPYFVSGNRQRFALPNLEEDSALTRFFTWSPKRIEFYTLRGHRSPLDFPAESVIHHFIYEDNGTNHRVPAPGQENFRFNLWLFQSSAPAGNQPVEVVVNDFSYLSFVSGDFENDGAVNDRDLTAWRTGFGMSGNAGRMNGDSEGDLDVDGADFLIWQRQQGAGQLDAARLISEPSGMSLLLIVLVISKTPRSCIQGIDRRHTGCGSGIRPSPNTSCNLAHRERAG